MSLKIFSTNSKEVISLFTQFSPFCRAHSTDALSSSGHIISASRFLFGCRIGRTYLIPSKSRIQIATAIYTQARLRTSLFCFLLYQLSLWWVKYRAQPEAISTKNHAGRNAPWQAETGWGEKVKPRKPAWNQAFLWLSICGCQVRNKNFCKKISLSEPKPIRFQTRKDFSCYFFDLSFSLLLDAW